MILGIDEVGRGPWAGPLVVGAVVFPDGVVVEGLADSKKLSSKKRQALDGDIRRAAAGYGLGWVYPDELDAIGLAAALRIATIRAVERVAASYHQIIIDGTINFLSDTEKGAFVQTLPKADALIPAVSAASIIAKVARDAYMTRQDALYPQYGFASHVGYGTARHRAALEKYGVTPLHRRSFAPIARMLTVATSALPKPATASASASMATSTAEETLPATTLSTPVTTKMLGDAAEATAAAWLEQNGFRVVERNWRTRRCEIDCIAEKDDVRYFIEVKYRSSQKQGGGVAAVTPQKLKQMTFAAELYQASHPYMGNYRLSVVSVDARRSIALIDIT